MGNKKNRKSMNKGDLGSPNKKAKIQSMNIDTANTCVVNKTKPNKANKKGFKNTSPGNKQNGKMNKPKQGTPESNKKNQVVSSDELTNKAIQNQKKRQMSKMKKQKRQSDEGNSSDTTKGGHSAKRRLKKKMKILEKLQKGQAGLDEIEKKLSNKSLTKSQKQRLRGLKRMIAHEMSGGENKSIESKSDGNEAKKAKNKNNTAAAGNVSNKSKKKQNKKGPSSQSEEKSESDNEADEGEMEVDDDDSNEQSDESDSAEEVGDDGNAKNETVKGNSSYKRTNPKGKRQR